MPTHYKGSSKEQLALNTYIKLTRATDAVNSHLFPGGKYHGLTVSQFGTLEALLHLGPMCQGEIGEKILKSSGNMTMVVDNLEKQGLVRRERDSEDRRQVFVHLTDKGEEIIGGLFVDHLSGLVNQFGQLTVEEQETLGALLKKLGMGNN